MAIRVVRLGSSRHPGEGLRLGTVRRPPRGVRKALFASLDYYDVWVPDLAPSAELVSEAQAGELTPARWSRWVRAYRAEMRAPAAERLLTLLAALSEQADISVGCYCEDESRCHRSVLRQLFVAAGATMA